MLTKEVTDRAGFEEYRKQVPRTLDQHGRKILVRGGQIQALEGDWNPKRLVVTRFPSTEQARRGYDSEEYRPLKALRLRTARGSVVLVEGGFLTLFDRLQRCIGWPVRPLPARAGPPSSISDRGVRIGQGR